MACPQCGFRFKVDRKYAGRRAQCPSAECLATIRIPALKDEAGPETPDQPPRRPRESVAHLRDLEPTRAKPAIKKKPPVEPVAEEFDLEAREPMPKRRASGTSASRPSRGASKANVGQSLLARLKRTKWQVWVGVGGLLIAVLGMLLAPKRSGNESGSESALVVAAEAPKPDVFKTQVQPFVKKYCGECHNADDPQGDIDLSRYDDGDAIIKGEPRKTWEKVLGMLEVGAMPPPDSSQPAAADKQVVVAWLNDKLFNLDCNLVNDPGRVTVRRLNRAEYNNTIRDLLGIGFQPADDFPSDDVGYGFDNIGDVLALSPLLLEKYLDAAEKISADVIAVADRSQQRRTVQPKELKWKEKWDIGEAGYLAMNSGGNTHFDYDAPVNGDYVLRIRAMADQFGNELARFELLIDGKKQQSFDVRGNKKADDYEHRFKLTTGKHRLEMAFVNDVWEKGKGDRNLYIGQLVIESPQLVAAGSAFLTVTPGNGLSPRDAATQVLQPFATRAFRRPATEAEVAKFANIAEAVINDGETYPQAMRYALQAVLVSPSFLFRIETDQKPNDPRVERAVTDYELASRLSYFLWSSMPDRELFELASRGELRKPDVLAQQTKRLLADPKSKAITDNFAAQWLNLRGLDEVTPDPKLFPEFNDDLRDDMRRETLMVFEAIVKEDRSVIDFLETDFTFVNKRLAKLYGMPIPKTEQFEKVSLNPAQRAGVLTHASILTLTSNPDRTSPVKRGKWIMENVLGTPPPPPPPNVPDLEETKKSKPNASLREQLEDHRASPMCASCHTTMDVLGFGFENFNAVGGWRERDGEHAIDPAGKLPSGESFKGPVELIRILKTRRKQFSRCLSEKLLTYSLGRGLEYYDRCAVDEILRRLEARQYRFSELVQSIVSSKPFLTRRGDGERD